MSYCKLSGLGGAILGSSECFREMKYNNQELILAMPFTILFGGSVGYLCAFASPILIPGYIISKFHKKSYLF